MTRIKVVEKNEIHILCTSYVRVYSTVFGNETKVDELDIRAWSVISVPKKH
jgi:hypothetical protein